MVDLETNIVTNIKCIKNNFPFEMKLFISRLINSISSTNQLDSVVITHLMPDMLEGNKWLSDDLVEQLIIRSTTPIDLQYSNISCIFRNSFIKSMMDVLPKEESLLTIQIDELVLSLNSKQQQLSKLIKELCLKNCLIIPTYRDSHFFVRMVNNLSDPKKDLEIYIIDSLSNQNIEEESNLYIIFSILKFINTKYNSNICKHEYAFKSSSVQENAQTCVYVFIKIAKTKIYQQQQVVVLFLPIPQQLLYQLHLILLQLMKIQNNEEEFEKEFIPKGTKSKSKQSIESTTTLFSICTRSKTKSTITPESKPPPTPKHQ